LNTPSHPTHWGRNNKDISMEQASALRVTHSGRGVEALPFSALDEATKQAIRDAQQAKKAAKKQAKKSREAQAAQAHTSSNTGISLENEGVICHQQRGSRCACVAVDLSCSHYPTSISKDDYFDACSGSLCNTGLPFSEKSIQLVVDIVRQCARGENFREVECASCIRRIHHDHGESAPKQAGAAAA